MTVKELKEKLNQFDDNLIVMIPNAGWHPFSIDPPDIPVGSVSQGVNEFDGGLFLDGYEEDCDTCAYYNTDRDDPPCCSCVDWENWERCNDGH